MTSPIWTNNDWTFDAINRVYNECEIIAKKELNLNCYPNQIEIISSDQMLDMYTSIGMPIYYQHWSFGKHFIQEQKNYQLGRSGLAYELVINLNPCINYLMEDNTMTTQALVIAHAAFGHNHFFKNNYLFKQWTDASSFLDYLIFAKDYVTAQEHLHGRHKIESWLDSCHALMDYGVNRYKRPAKVSMEKEKQRQRERANYLQTQVSDLYRLLPTKKSKEVAKKFPIQPEENLLYFFEKYSPDLEPWQRELLRIVRKIAQYFYPQGQCVSGNHMVSTQTGLLKFDELVTTEGYCPNSSIMLLTNGNKLTPISHTYKRLAQVVKVTTSSGRTFTGTPEHPLTVLRNGKEELIQIEDLTTNDYLVTNLNYDIFSDTNPKLGYNIDSHPIECQICGLESNFIGSHVSQMHNITPLEYTKKYGQDVSNELSKIKKSTNIIQVIPTSMTPVLGALLPYFTYIGYNRYNSFFSFESTNRTLAVKFQSLLYINFGLKVELSIDQFKRYCVSFNSFTLKKFLEDNFNDLYSLEVPQKLRMSTKETVKEYIKTFIDLFSKRRSNIAGFMIPAYKDSVNLFAQLQTILYGFGIGSRITESNRITYEGMCRVLGLPEDIHHRPSVDTIGLFIMTDFYTQFENMIGTDLDLPTAKSTNKYHVIPNGLHMLNLVRKQLINDRKHLAKQNRNVTKNMSYKQKVQAKLLIKQSFMSSTNLPEIKAKELTIGHVLEHWTKFQNLKYCTQIPEAKILLDLINKSLGKFYDQIVNISFDNDKVYVYDVTVPENHLFWLDGVISHNTKVMNEGFASLTHYEIMNRLHNKGLTTDGSHLEFLALHSNVLFQPSFDSRHYNGINPYALGFAMLRDIQRMCQTPTKEDFDWFPIIKNANPQELILDAVENYRDESFIRQWLSPKIIRDWHLFSVHDDRANSESYTVKSIHNEAGYLDVREKLADQYLRTTSVPHLEVIDVDKKTRHLTLRYTKHNGRILGNVKNMMPHLAKLWSNYPVTIRNEDGGLIAFYDNN